MESNKNEKEDFVLSGLFVTFGLLVVMGVLVYLFTIQTNAQKCKPIYDAKGMVTNNCPVKNPVSQPVQDGSGQIQFLENLKPQENKIPEIDGQ